MEDVFGVVVGSAEEVLARCALRRASATLRFRCPRILMLVRGWAAEDMEQSVVNVVIWMFECLVCGRIRLTGTTCFRMWLQVLEPSYHSFPFEEKYD